MTPLQLRPPTLDEIVFEGRNKAYGAFELRQMYPQHLRRALAIAIALFALLVVAPLVASRLWPNAALPAPVLKNEPDVTLTTIIMPKAAEPVVTPPPAAAKAPQLKEVATRVVKDALVPPRPEQTTVVDDALLTTVAAPKGDTGATTGVITDGATGGASVPTAGDATAPKEEVFVHAEVMPEFEGGQAALFKYLQRNLRYPSQALGSQVEGKVFVAFTVNTLGEIMDVEVIKGLGYGTDEEAARVIRAMPRWQAGKQNGRSVSVRYTLPITFKIAH
ncbi:energy transducer TonB [Hymenobacter latericus]|uniref:energy transducer TonB n=1 Tax=Hymenobacter sp. YIM 151858-1 TaxID=2987688 RepID=UPI002226BB69|nr:energy transducer TonB [Hymenobacter sp. YIM 151858-1]UYZ58719.1 TonB family protein [Hymenobacter sp. YIM 151858-1]